MNSHAEAWPPQNPTSPLAVLISGGLDSAILLGEALRVYPRVIPITIRTGAVWEDTEQLYLRRFLDAVRSPALAPLVTLSMPTTDLYGSHWSVTGVDVPAAHTADELCYLPGRNVILLSKALLWCHLQGVPEVATAPLGSNPFPDATDAFYDGFAAIVSQGVSGSVRVLRPYARLGLHKTDVLHRGVGMPLEHTFSCIRPERNLHCGICSKCSERYVGFAEAGLTDPTHYAHPIVSRV
jgi:7-cyano-7-deazaguanine synthase